MDENSNPSNPVLLPDLDVHTRRLITASIEQTVGSMGAPRRDWRGWIAVGLTILSMGAALGVFIFKTKTEASEDHRMLEKAIAEEHVENKLQDRHLNEHGNRLDRIDTNVQKIADRLNVRGVERAPPQ